MSHLLQPLSAGTLHLKNRLVMPPMATSKATSKPEPDGRMSRPLLDYYAEKSQGGAFGLVIIEHAFVTKQGQNRAAQPSVADDATIDGWSELAEIIHRNGSKCVMQINHSGGACSTQTTGMEVVSASDMPSPVGKGDSPVRPLTQPEIATIAREFAAAAGRVKRAGFNGVEIHAAHGYLLNQFFSPLLNKRADEYGGDVRGRIRFHLEVIASVRAEVGDDFPVLLRLGACDYLEGGTTIQDSIAAAAEFERAGVDVIDITGGITGYLRPGHDEPGYFAELSEAVNGAVSVPVILTGGVTEASQAEELLAAGKADLIGVGRAVLRDSGWAARAVAQAGSALP